MMQFAQRVASLKPEGAYKVLERARELEAQGKDIIHLEIGPGAKPGLFFPTLAVVEPGDEVLYPDPGFPTYPAIGRMHFFSVKQSNQKK